MTNHEGGFVYIRKVNRLMKLISQRKERTSREPTALNFQNKKTKCPLCSTEKPIFYEIKASIIAYPRKEEEKNIS